MIRALAAAQTARDPFQAAGSRIAPRAAQATGPADEQPKDRKQKKSRTTRWHP